MNSAPLRIKFIANDEFIDKLSEEARNMPQLITCDKKKEEKDATRLGFDFETVSSVITVFQAALTTAKVAQMIFNWWSNTKKNKVVIQTPFKTLELRSQVPISEEDVRRFLQDSAQA
ncbi:MAG: hypothetical protein U1E43_01330 [Rhodospirillales bacterium]